MPGTDHSLEEPPKSLASRCIAQGRGERKPGIHAAGPVKGDPDASGKYRINGIVSDLPECAQAFSCKAGQPMVREKACEVW